MLLVLFYSLLLLGGIVVSQAFDLTHIAYILHTVTIVFLAYIMVKVGLEFTLDKKRLKSYGWDYMVAATAATFPWLFCVVYMLIYFRMDIIDALLVGRFAAPTSAGVLFAMLGAAGLGTTWLFQKARVLAIFDDLDTVMLMIPLQILLVGFRLHLIAVVIILTLMLIAAYRRLHSVHLPRGNLWLLAYGAAIVAATQLLERTTHVELEVLFPAFLLGCIIYNPHDPYHPEEHPREHKYLEPESGSPHVVDHIITGGFMFLVGSSLPRIAISDVSVQSIIGHVTVLTLLLNIGKCFPSFCYRKEASLRERIALSVAMFPRGEVGAGVLLLAMNYGMGGLPVTVAILSLSLNLLLTGLFIAVVIMLVKKPSLSAPD